MALLSIAGLLATAPAADAAEWGYEQITPADSSSVGIYGIQASGDMSMVVTRTRLVPIPGYRGDGRGMVYSYGMPRVGAPWDVGPIDATNGSQLFPYVDGVAHDGSSVLYSASLRSLGGFGRYRTDAQGGAVNMTVGVGNGVMVATPMLDAVANWGRSATDPVYLGRAGVPAVAVSLKNDGTPMSVYTLGGSRSTNETFKHNSLAADASSVIFGSEDADVGDNDGGALDVYRRIVTPGSEETILVSDANDPGDPDADFDAEYRWATANHSHIFFKTREALTPDDTDDNVDLYVRLDNGSLIRVSQGELVDGSPTGNATGGSALNVEWSRSSADGNRTYFVTAERLTQDAPEAGTKLYERDLAEERTRFVAGPLTSTQLVSAGPAPLSFRAVRVTPGGVVFATVSALAGAPDDGTAKIYAWTRDGGLNHVDAAAVDAPSSAAANSHLVAVNVSGETHAVSEIRPIEGGKSVSDDGERVFFTTAQSLVAEDADGGYMDVYMWSPGEGVSLVSPPGRAPYDVGYLDSSADGTEVYLNTNETILPSDTDPNAADVYLAIEGGGSPPGLPDPDADPTVCNGDACQGPDAEANVPIGPVVGSNRLSGDGNLSDARPAPRTRLVVPRAKSARGIATRLRVRVPAAGRVVVDGRAVRRAAVSTRAGGAVGLRVALKPRLRKRLRQTKRLTVAVRVAYRARGGGSATKRVQVTFRQARANRARGKQGGR